MSKLAPLPPSPTNGDLATAITSLHECVEEGKVQTADLAAEVTSLRKMLDAEVTLSTAHRTDGPYYDEAPYFMQFVGSVDGVTWYASNPVLAAPWTASSQKQTWPVSFG